MAKFKILIYQKLERISCIKNQNKHEHVYSAKTQKEIQNTTSLSFCIFHRWCISYSDLQYRSWQSFWELKVGALWYCFQRMRHLMLFFQSRFFSVSYADTFSSTWHMLRENTWWQGSLALSIRNRHNCVLIYQKM